MHEEATWQRLLPLAGVAFAALMVLAAVAFPLTPGGDVSPGKQPEWLGRHHDAIVAQGYIRALGAIAFVLLAAAVADVVRRRTGSALGASLALVGGVSSGLLLLLAQAAGIGSALAAADGTGADVVRSLGYAEDAFLTLSSLPAVLLFAAAGVAFVRARIVPAWLGWTTLAGVPFALLDAVSYDGGPVEAVGFVGLVYFLVWSLAVGTALVARPHPAPVAAPA